MKTQQKSDFYGYMPTDEKIKALQKQAFQASFQNFLPTFKNRRFQVFCIGIPRSGTHSLGYMLETNYIAKHEPLDDDTIHHLLRFLVGDYTRERMKAILKSRDRKLGLEVEASHYLHLVTPLLLSLFPDAKFIHTYRNPFTWLDSEINQNLSTRSATPKWRALERARYEHYGFSYEPEEQALKQLDDIWPISNYLSYWRDHSEFVLKTIPKEKLLVLKTEDLSSSIEKISTFLEINPDSIDTSVVKSGTNTQKEFDFYSHISRDFVKEKVALHGGELAKQWLD